MHFSGVSNIHPVDELAQIRATLKVLTERENELKTAVSALMGENDSLAGAEHVAFQKLSTRKGAVDAAALAKAAGVSADEFRKPSVAVLQIVVERHAPLH